MRLHNSAMTFSASGLLANNHVQSILTSGPLRRWLIHRRVQAYQKASCKEIIALADATRLLALRTRSAKPRGLVIMLHGWEGSANSSYMLALGDALWRSGFTTVRLNFRDHGDSHYLNSGLFHSCRLQEVVQAVRQITSDSKLPTYLTGFSLGGNFALRTACHAADFPNPLQHVFAISPVLVPKHVLHELEHGFPVYEHYFMRKWRHSLRLKQELFPELYGDGDCDWNKAKGVYAMTRILVEHYTDFDSIDDYLAGYTINNDYLLQLQVPTTIITARDDPIIPIADFASLPVHPHLQLEIHQHGGHCGFISNWQLHSWLEQTLAERINQQIKAHE
jgi:predicted alpha/beta-fold hydrolase